MPRITLNEIDYLEFREGKEGTVEIFDIAVMSERGKGIGTEMIDYLKRQGYNLIYAFTRESNGGAREFYKKNCFQEILVNRFYPDENAIMVIWRRK